MVCAKDIPSPQKYIPPFHKFGDLFRKHTGRKTIYTLNVMEPYKEEIQVSTEVFTSLQEAVDNKTRNITIETALEDELVL